MTAKEMFEKLGYKFNQDNNIITYADFNDVNCIGIITFNTKEKWFKSTSVTSYDNLDRAINLKELQAINKQVEELRW